jgi:DNA-3-methyladenine glycosylase
LMPVGKPIVPSTQAKLQPRSLERGFFARPALVVAKDLIGKYVCRRIDGEVIAAAINETEAYIGPHDLACHGSKGRTTRTEVMFGPAGHWYVYFIYGIHWMLNAVTDDVDHPAAVLIRGAGPWNGPAKLTKAMSIDRSFNKLPIDAASELWIEDRGLVIPRRKIRRTPRIGVDYAGDWAAKPYRFVVEGPR